MEAEQFSIGEKEAYQRTLQERVNECTEENEGEFRRTIYLAILEKAELGNKVATAFLVVTGATVSLFLPNLAALEDIIPVRTSLIFLFCLLVSALFGLVQKFAAVQAHHVGETMKSLTPKIQEIVATQNKLMEDAAKLANKAGVSVENNFNGLKIFHEVNGQLPSVVGWWAKCEMEKGAADPLLPMKRGMMWFRVFFYAGLIHAFIFIAAYFYILLSVQVP